jgi:demethylmenaquinone methyltransferase/2-methoxy-6-polyprenyl-1,4-benzoquinol methylase
MSLAQRDLFIKNIFTAVAPRVDFLSTGFSLGLDRYWRARAVRLSGVKRGDCVLDVCTGTGKLAMLLSRKVGATGSVNGVDFCEEMLNRAKNKVTDNYQNLTYLLADAKRLPFGGDTFDAVTVSFGMRNIPDTALALEEVNRVLKPGGTFVCLELTRPRARWFVTLYEWYTSYVMPAVASLVIKTSAPYRYLPWSISSFYPPDEFRTIIEAHGYEEVTIHPLTLGIATLYRAVKHG